MSEKKFINLSIPVLQGNELKYVKECISAGWIAEGRYIGEFEKNICKYTGAEYGVACVNGTAGLHIALKLAGIRAGDEVIVPALTFISPVNTVKYLQGEPVFMDCDNYMNLDPEKLEDFCRKECRITRSGLRNKISGRIIKAVIPVHIFGNPCDMAGIMRIAKKYNLKVIEDATESLGSYYTEGIYRNKYTGTIGDFGVCSFNANKIITTGGGGMILSNNGKMAKKARYLINQAKDDSVKYIHNEIGYNFRLANLQAAVGVAQLENLDKIIRIKKRNYGLYKKELGGIDGLSLLAVPKGTSPNYWFYSLMVEKEKYGMDREKLMQKLKEKSIQVRPLWYLSNLQKPYRRNQSYKIEKSLRFWKTVLNVPCSSDLTGNEIKEICGTIRKFKKQKD
jgi:perosamine synthetase